MTDPLFSKDLIKVVDRRLDGEAKAGVYLFVTMGGGLMEALIYTTQGGDLWVSLLAIKLLCALLISAAWGIYKAGD
jgi:hypothetical protein